MRERSAKEIAAEVTQLKTLFDNRRFRRYSGFGDDHFKTIRIQIAVLENDWNERDINERYFDADENSAAYDTLQWKNGEEVEETPFQSWQSLVRP